MKLCDCAHSIYYDAPVLCRPDTAINIGDVYTINESVCTPIYDILRNSNLERTQFVQSQQSFHSVCSRPFATRHENGRPCIVMQQYQESSTRTMTRKVCLLTTYSGQHISTLPKIFKEFSVAVYPHYASIADGDDHLHSLPRWGRENAWIIAWELSSRRPLINRVRVGQEDVVFGETAMDKLVHTCYKKRREWLSKCKKNPKFAGPFAKEFFDHRKAITAAEVASKVFIPFSDIPTYRILIMRKYSLATQDSSRTLRNSIYRGPNKSRVGY